MEIGQCGDTLEITGPPVFTGAEAVLYRVEWLGAPALAKCRIAKPYRHPVLDRELRLKRTVTEARAIMAALRAGANAPSVFLVDPPAALIVMEFIDGRKLSEIVEEDPSSALRYSREVGRQTGLLHEAGMAHGDLTTSNVIVSRSGEVFLIDFGLADLKAEELDKAVDVHLYIRSLESTHPEHVDSLLKEFINGYSTVRGSDKAREILDLVDEIRMMGRYREERRRRRG